MSESPRKSLSKPWGVLAVLLVGATAVIAWSRAGLLNLPAVPRGISAESAGLAGLDRMGLIDRWLWTGSDPLEAAAGGAKGSDPFPPAALKVKAGIAAVNGGDPVTGLALIREGVRLDPASLVYSNAYRMEVFRLKRQFLSEAKAEGQLTPQFPPHLDRQPIAFFEELAAAPASREVKLQLALAWVDEMLLFPALEIKAPASVEAVKILTRLIESGEEAYVPALFARGLNHLHRPARLVWPESDKTPPDAAAQDIGRCVAIGRKLGIGSARLQAGLAVALGDAYIKAGEFSVARSWWQVAQNLCGDSEIQEAVRRRYAWRDEEMLDRLEAELDRARSELDQPMTDLAMMWN